MERQVCKQLIKGKDQVQSSVKSEKRVNFFNDDVMSIKVYKFDNTKKSWHEFALKFRVIADSRGYEEIIDGTKSRPDEKEVIEIVEKNYVNTKKAKKEKLAARMTNKKGYRDLVMSMEGISLNIVENATSDKLSKGDLRKAWGRLKKMWNPKTSEDKVEVYTKFLNYRLENVRQKPMDWLAFLEKKDQSYQILGI